GGAPLHRLHQRHRTEGGRRLHRRGWRAPFHPADREGENGDQTPAGDVPRPLGHLPQGRESRHPVHPQRQDRAGRRPADRPLRRRRRGRRQVNIGFLMLTDYSEAVNGKLYLTGGGWNVLRLPELPHEWSFHIGLGIDVAWHETNNPHELSVTIQDPDGIELGDGLTANFETGRPPGMPQGQEQRLVMAIASPATFPTAGPHAAVVEVNGEELGRARFYLMEGVPEGG